MSPQGPTQLDRIEEKVTELSEILTGNGDTAKGLVVRVSRVEDRVAAGVWVAGAIVVAVIGGWIAGPKLADHLEQKQSVSKP